MHLNIGKWGNSLALRLPREVAREAGLAEGAAVNLEVRDGTIVVTPVRRKIALSELLAGVRPRQGHGETDWGGPQGREGW